MTNAKRASRIEEKPAPVSQPPLLDISAYPSVAFLQIAGDERDVDKVALCR